jgi:hypothetical protein
MRIMGSDLSPWGALNGTGCEICIAEVMQSWKVFEDGSVDISVVIEGDVEKLTYFILHEDPNFQER